MQNYSFDDNSFAFYSSYKDFESSVLNSSLFTQSSILKKRPIFFLVISSILGHFEFESISLTIYFKHYRNYHASSFSKSSFVLLNDLFLEASSLKSLLMFDVMYDFTV